MPLKTDLWDISKMAEQAALRSCLSTETLKRNRNWQNQLCQTSGKQSEVYNSQVNAESKTNKQTKSNLAMTEKLCGIFYFPLPHPLPSLVVFLKVVAHLPSVRL